eukprot:COSAG05_NODE_2373_length_3161_cov_16.174233_4_plen_91_part_00
MTLYGVKVSQSDRNETWGGSSEPSGVRQTARCLGVSTVRASRRGHGADVILARGSQYSTRPTLASHSFSTKLQLEKKEKKKKKKMEINFR